MHTLLFAAVDWPLLLPSIISAVAAVAGVVLVWLTVRVQRIAIATHDVIAETHNIVNSKRTEMERLIDSGRTERAEQQRVIRDMQVTIDVLNRLLTIGEEQQRVRDLAKKDAS